MAGPLADVGRNWTELTGTSSVTVLLKTLLGSGEAPTTQRRSIELLHGVVGLSAGPAAHQQQHADLSYRLSDAEDVVVRSAGVEGLVAWRRRW